TLVEDLAADVRVALPEHPDLAVLLRHQALIQGRDLDVEVVGREVEVRCEPLDGVPLSVPREVERGRLVAPFDLVEVQEPRELPLARVREAHGVDLEHVGQTRHVQAAQAPPAPARACGRDPPRTRSRLRLPSEAERSSHTLSRAMANTPWPRLTRS